MPARAVFLDRDGTINVEKDFLSDPADLELENGSAEGLRLLHDAGFVLVVVTNQSGVARGYYSEEDIARVNEALASMLEAEGAKLERFYHCPHHPEGTVARYARRCDCRKPAPGLLLRAAGELGIDLEGSYMVGDYTRDLEAGRAAGVKTVLVRTGYGARSVEEVRERGLADHVSGDLLEAARWILDDSSRTGGAIVDSADHDR